MEMQTVDHLLAAVLDGQAQRAAEFLRADPGLLRARNMFGVSAVHAAHFTGQADLAARLLPSDPPDFFLAAELGRLDVIDDQLGRQPALARELDDRGSTALHGSCYWGQADAARRLLHAGADPSAPTRDQVLQSEADWVHQLVAAGTGGVGAMLGHALAHGENFASCAVFLERGHEGRWRRGRCAEKIGQNPFATKDWRGAGGIGGHSQDASLP